MKDLEQWEIVDAIQTLVKLLDSDNRSALINYIYELNDSEFPND